MAEGIINSVVTKINTNNNSVGILNKYGISEKKRKIPNIIIGSDNRVHKCKGYATDRCKKCGLKRMCYRI
jgi:hypothetical protein